VTVPTPLSRSDACQVRTAADVILLNGRVEPSAPPQVGLDHRRNWSASVSEANVVGARWSRPASAKQRAWNRSDGSRRIDRTVVAARSWR
jgi:hypothetical protein